MDPPTNLRVFSNDTLTSARTTAGLRINGVFDPCKPAAIEGRKIPFSNTSDQVVQF